MGRSINRSINNNKQKIASKRNAPRPKFKFKKCNECNRKRKYLNEFLVCDSCSKLMKAFIPSGNNVIDDFIRQTLTNNCKGAGRMEFVPYDRFNNIEFIFEGGFSKIYKAIWIDGQITKWNEGKKEYDRSGDMTVALKELNNSQNINPKELLNEV
jgi:hypothetical protein